MKKIWMLRKNKSAVSPVIATILMVAITVVLAAVLYVMVMGFGGSTSHTPTGAITSVTGTSSNKVITFGAITPTTTWTNLKVSIQNGTLTPELSNAITTVSGDSVTITFTGDTPTVFVVSGTNLAANGNINTGDYITITGTGAAALKAGTSYTVALIYAPTGSAICSTTFTA
jgi:flagellin-like protein